VLTAEGNRTAHLDFRAPDDTFQSVTTDPAGGETTFYRSADGLNVSKHLACGTSLDFTYDFDPEYRYRYLTESVRTTETGLEKVTTRNRLYEDTNGDRLSDLITDFITVNGNTSVLEHVVYTGRKTFTSPEGRQTIADYAPDTLQTERIAVPGLYEAAFDYYADGRLMRILTGDREWSFTYDARGNLYTVADPRGHVTTYEEYDPAGRVKAVRRPDNSVVRFDYDLNGNMTVLTTPSTVDHGFGYNAVNRNDLYETPQSGGYLYTYDRDRRLTETRFPSGRRIEHIYADGRLDYTLTPEGTIDYTYDCGTKLRSVARGAESIVYSYDASLVTGEVFSGTLNLSLGYTYNTDFDVESFTYAGATETYTYDNDGLLTGAGRFTIGRNAENGLPESATGGAMALSRTFNGYGEPDAESLTVGGVPLSDRTLTRDNAGRIVAKTETVAGVTTDYAYTYDAAGRLLTVVKDGQLVEEYAYNANGSRIYERNTLRGIERDLSYSVEDHLLAAGTATYDYDPDGFLTRKTDGTAVTTYDYSSRGELLGVSLPDGTSVEYLHDPLGRRIAKKVNGTITEKYLWSGLTTLLAVYDGADTLLMRFEYADGRMPVAVLKEGVTYYPAYDQVGSLRAVADGAGNVVKRIDYDAFGNIIEDSNPLFDTPFGFAGGLHDRDTGLVRFGYRDYDPGVGRWTAKDPILFAGGDTDLYGYVNNNSINNIDPYGELAITVPTIVVYGVFTVAAIYYGTKAINDTQTYLDSKRWGGTKGPGPGICNEDKRKLKRANKYRPPNNQEPDKNPPPPIKPTSEQQIKREPMLARVWRVLTSQFNGPGGP
jgi:RHS repeat-associated protein